MYKLFNVKRWGSMGVHLVLEELGVPYQSFIGEFLRRLAQQ